jgi:hypothetical protein
MVLDEPELNHKENLLKEAELFLKNISAASANQK